jgi:hypothetical protein
MIESTTIRKRGAPLGNQYARKHGFYSRIPTPEQQEAIQAGGVGCGIDAEVAFMRLKIISLLKNDPWNFKVLRLAFTRFVRLLYRQQLFHDYLRKQAAGFSETIEHFLARILPVDSYLSPES